MVQRVAVVVCIAFALTACSRSHEGVVVLTPQSFLVSAYLAAAGDANVCAIATRQARLPETRSLGAQTQATLSSLRDDVAAAARRKDIALPQGMEEKKIALRDNLSILPGRIFDRGYALAMVQDSRSMLQEFDAASRLNDPDVHNIINKYRAQIQAEQRDSRQLLASLGGPPWPNFEP